MQHTCFTSFYNLGLLKKKEYRGVTGKIFDTTTLLTYIFYSRTPPPPFYNYALDPPSLPKYRKIA